MTHNVFYNDDYTGCRYAFDTTRKSAVLADRINESGIATITDPQAFRSKTVELINYVHQSDYVSAVMSGTPRELAETQGFDWDPKIPDMAIAHNSGLVAAVADVMSTKNRVAGTLSSGLHHARREYGSGYCTFNGLAVGATHAMEMGAERVLILDFDAHGGGGTRSLLDENVVQIDVSTSFFDEWDAKTTNDALLRSDRVNYIDDITEALALATEAGSFDIVLYNAGMDPANSSVTAADLDQREQMVANWAGENGHKVVYTLAGGYTFGGLTMDSLVDLHKMTVSAFSSN